MDENNVQNENSITSLGHSDNQYSKGFTGIYHSDVLDGLEVAIDKNQRFDVIIVDPPYNIGKDFGNNLDNMELEDYVAWSKSWMDMCFKLLADDGLIYVYGFSEILARLSVHYPLSQQKWLVWHYTNKTVASLKFWQRSHESILCLWKRKRPNLCIDAIRVPYTEGFIKLAGKERKNTKSRYGTKSNTRYMVHNKGALPRDVIKVPALAGRAGAKERWFKCEDCQDIFNPKELKHHRNHITWKHPTQKPMTLTRILIKSVLGDSRNGRVLVLFVGSGSECVVAQELEHKYLGFELNANFVEFARTWVRKTSK